jgi:hypothetical protein
VGGETGGGVWGAGEGMVPRWLQRELGGLGWERGCGGGRGHGFH